jgi:hypothetical protein
MTTPHQAHLFGFDLSGSFCWRYLVSVSLVTLSVLMCGHAAGQALVLERKMEGPDVCSLPKLAPGYVLHVFRVRAISSGPTDGTYSDFGEGQGEFVTVQLLNVLVSPVHLKHTIFRIHPFPGAIDETGIVPPEHLITGKTYLIVFPYHLRHTPRKPQDLIGLTRCGVVEDTPENSKRLKAFQP